MMSHSIAGSTGESSNRRRKKKNLRRKEAREKENIMKQDRNERNTEWLNEQNGKINIRDPVHDEQGGEV